MAVGSLLKPLAKAGSKKVAQKVGKEVVEETVDQTIKNTIETGVGRKIIDPNDLKNADNVKLAEFYDEALEGINKSNETDSLNRMGSGHQLENASPKASASPDDIISGILKDNPAEASNVEDEFLKTFIPEAAARKRNAEMKKAGITNYTDEFGHNWKLEGITSKQWRNTATRGATKKPMNPFTGEIGTRLASTRRYVNKRLRGLVSSSPEEAVWKGNIEKTKAAINNKYGLTPKDPGYMTLEHRIADADWRRLGLKGNPDDSPNLWLTTRYEANIKTAIENSIRQRKGLKGNYIVDFNPETTNLHVMKLEDFKLHSEPTGKAFEKVNGKYNGDAIEQYLNTLE